MSEWKQDTTSGVEYHRLDLVYCDLVLGRPFAGAAWYLTCSELKIDCVRFGYESLEVTKEQAIAVVRVKLQRMLKELP